MFSLIPSDLPDEVFEDVIAGQHCRIERIISKGHSTPNGTWLCQNRNEWVMLLKGTAGLIFEDVDDVIVLKPGDYLTITAHTKHRVEWTDDTQETIWLAVHYD
jgi:cupin 2 domain-containing protein